MKLNAADGTKKFFCGGGFLEYFMCGSSCLRSAVQKEFGLVKYFILKVTAERKAEHVLFDASKEQLKMH